MSTPLVIDQADPEDSLFSQQFHSDLNPQNVPWWQKNFLLQQPTMMNAWNGVFPTVIVNIFGIVIFLRMGWVVGTAGLSNAFIIVALCTLFSAVTVLSAIGICERTKIQHGGIYFLVSHVLGKRIGGSIGIIYTFGQATATSLVALGFGESIAKLLGITSVFATKFLAIFVLCVLTGLNFGGLRFVIRLQLLLLCFLGVAIVDFLLGALFVKPDLKHGINYMSRERLNTNWEPHYMPINCTIEDLPTFTTKHESFFSVFGVLFANFIGVLAGVNMSVNLENPHKDIAKGELSALGVSFGLCFLFMGILGGFVDRSVLLCDYMISEQISLTKLFFLTGLYVSCLSSILSSSLGTARVVQGIAAEGLIPSLNNLVAEESPEKNPIKATILVTSVAVFFVLIGDLNQLAILSSMPFLITYAFVNYAYVSLAMSHDLDNLNTEIEQKKTYGSVHDFKAVDASGTSSTLDNLFPGDRTKPGIYKTPEIAQFETKPWYTKCINRYVSFAAAIIHIFVVIFINKWFALLHLIVFICLYLYLGRTCPISEDGLTQFSFIHMIRVALQPDSFKMNVERNDDNAYLGGSLGGMHVVPQNPLIQDSGFRTDRLNEQNQDYSTRKPYHHSEQLKS